MQAAQAARFDWSHALLNRREKKSNRAPARCCRGWICDTAAGFSVNNSRAAYTCLCAQLRQANGRSLTMQYHRHGLTGHIDFGHQRCRVHGHWHARLSDSAPEKPAKAIAKASGISIKKTISAHRPKERLEISPHPSLRKIVFLRSKGPAVNHARTTVNAPALLSPKQKQLCTSDAIETKKVAHPIGTGDQTKRMCAFSAFSSSVASDR